MQDCSMHNNIGSHVNCEQYHVVSYVAMSKEVAS